jgi:tetratricopeptide (TPR) repeat protein
MDLRRLIVPALILASCLTAASSGVRTLSVADLLDRYAAGDFDRVVSELETLETYEPVLIHLREHGQAWIDAKGPEAAARRELTAATFALEAARAGQWHEWKIIRKQPKMCVPGSGEVQSAASTEDGSDEQQQQQAPPPKSAGECYTPPDVLRWQAPPLLIEWGCQLLRQHKEPAPHERWWQLAALAVAQRSEDPQFLIGDVNIGKGPERGEIVNTQDEIKHLDHVVERFPKESRFQLAQGIARDLYFPQDAMVAYRALEEDPDVGGEATMRLGAMQVRPRTFVIDPNTPPLTPQNVDAALRLFEKAETLTRDPYVVFLARYFKGQALAGDGRIEDAEGALRGATDAVPNAQSATIALASLMFADGRRVDAQQLITSMLAASPLPNDPWRGYVHADDRFWPRLMARLRLEITR